MKFLVRRSAIALSACALIQTCEVQAQCSKRWGANPKDSVTAIENHTLYRDFINMRKPKEAYNNWKITYAIAPTATEKHQKDGVVILMELVKSETDPAKKKAYLDELWNVYGDWQKCYGKEAEVLMRKGIDMYTLQQPAMETYSTFKSAANLYGENMPYYMMGSYAYLAAYLYDQGQVSKEDMRTLHKHLNAIADKQASGKEAANFGTAKTTFNQYFEGVKKPFFDCDYYVQTLMPSYKYEATKENDEARKVLKSKFKIGGCLDTDAHMVTLLADDKKWDEDDFRLNASDSKKGAKAERDGQFAEAIKYYEVAIQKEGTNEDKGKWAYRVAYLYYDKLNNFSTARTFCRKAVEFRPNWGEPIMLIGAMYASSTRSCGDEFTGRFALSAAIDEYQRAKSIDPSIADEANKAISRASAGLPGSDQVFQRGLKAGSSVQTGCWIGETTTLRTRD